MKKLTRFFFYYTFLLLNAMTVVSVVFLETPYNLIYAVVLTPALVFFWLKITDPIGATESSWSARLVIAIGVLSSLSILGFYLFQVEKQEIAALEEQLANERATSGLQIASISGELSLLRTQLLEKTSVLMASTSAEIKPNQESQEILALLNALESSDKDTTDDNELLAIGKVKSSSEAVSNAYEQGSSSSKIVGIIEPDKIYNYFEYTGSWYLVELSEGRQGWVESDKVILDTTP